MKKILLLLTIEVLALNSCSRRLELRAGTFWAK